MRLLYEKAPLIAPNQCAKPSISIWYRFHSYGIVFPQLLGDVAAIVGRRSSATSLHPSFFMEQTTRLGKYISYNVGWVER
ncbi:MAG: hypothetical protein AAF316_12855, partial [Cyanobacteria bacterium P01_A01_bin.80]